METWKSIPNYEGRYEISSSGDIKSLKRGGKYLKPVKNHNGYYIVWLYKNKKDRQRRVSRLVASAFIPNPDNKPCVNHKNGIKTDNRVDNIEWCTHSENQKHAYDNGLCKPKNGEKNGRAKLNEDDVLFIRTFKCFFTYDQLSLIFNVRASTLHSAYTNNSWKSI